VQEIDHLKKQVKEQQVETSRLQKRAEKAEKKLVVAGDDMDWARGNWGDKVKEIDQLKENKALLKKSP